MSWLFKRNSPRVRCVLCVRACVASRLDSPVGTVCRFAAWGVAAAIGAAWLWVDVEKRKEEVQSASEFSKEEAAQWNQQVHDNNPSAKRNFQLFPEDVKRDLAAARAAQDKEKKAKKKKKKVRRRRKKAKEEPAADVPDEEALP